MPFLIIILSKTTQLKLSDLFNASSRSPLQTLFKLCHWGHKWLLPKGQKVYTELY